jgi:hypothetical protein
MVCRPEDEAESDMGRGSENEETRRGVGVSEAPVREQARMSTRLGRRRSAPPRRGWS